MKASTFVSCDRSPSEVWVVFCTRCGEEIGTMSGETLAKAVYFAHAKGGVLCPECRETSCDVCGNDLSGFAGVFRCLICEQRILSFLEKGSPPLSSCLNLNTTIAKCICGKKGVCGFCLDSNRDIKHGE